jgi:hypothetical protein
LNDGWASSFQDGAQAPDLESQDSGLALRAPEMSREKSRPEKSLFVIFVDRIFTNSFGRVFTNVFDVIAQTPAISWLYPACNAN